MCFFLLILIVIDMNNGTAQAVNGQFASRWRMRDGLFYTRLYYYNFLLVTKMQCFFLNGRRKDVSFIYYDTFKQLSRIFIELRVDELQAISLGLPPPLPILRSVVLSNQFVSAMCRCSRFFFAAGAEHLEGHHRAVYPF